MNIYCHGYICRQSFKHAATVTTFFIASSQHTTDKYRLNKAY